MSTIAIITAPAGRVRTAPHAPSGVVLGFGGLPAAVFLRGVRGQDPRGRLGR